MALRHSVGMVRVKNSTNSPYASLSSRIDLDKSIGNFVADLDGNTASADGLYMGQCDQKVNHITDHCVHAVLCVI